MKQKSRKNTKKEKIVRAKAVRAKKYESHYLALILVGFLLLEGCLVTTTSSADWRQGVAVLDMSVAVSETYAGLTQTFQPVAVAVGDVNQFYQIAATEMTPMLDFSGEDNNSEVSTVASGVYDFYQQASTQLASMLDLSSVSSWPSQVAGASIEK